MDVKPTFDYQPERPGEIGNFVSDPNLLLSTFGCIPSTTVEEGIKQTIDWLKSN